MNRMIQIEYFTNMMQPSGSKKQKLEETDHSTDKPYIF